MQHQERLKRQKKRERKANLIENIKIFSGAFLITIGLAILMSFTTDAVSVPVDSDALTITLTQDQLNKPSDLQNAMTAGQLQPTAKGSDLQGGLVRR